MLTRKSRLSLSTDGVTQMYGSVGGTVASSPGALLGLFSGAGPPEPRRLTGDQEVTAAMLRGGTRNATHLSPCNLFFFQ